MQKIIFLDIDGPMIPLTSMIFNTFASWEQILDERCVRVLKLIIEQSEAQIVFNTTHNRMLYNEGGSTLGPGLIQRFNDADFEFDIHPTVCTDFPDIPRDLAITKWLADHGDEDTKWVAFDDVFLDFEEAYTTNYELGIGVDEFNHAAYYLDFEQRIVL